MLFGGVVSNLSRRRTGLSIPTASHLSTDTLLAFEDDEVQAFQQQSGDDTTTSKMFEMCTLLAKRWVYAFAQNDDCDQELYILFDPASHGRGCAERGTADKKGAITYYHSEIVIVMRQARSNR